jgi:hypothetical protein
VPDAAPRASSVQSVIALVESFVARSTLRFRVGHRGTRNVERGAPYSRQRTALPAKLITGGEAQVAPESG